MIKLFKVSLIKLLKTGNYLLLMMILIKKQRRLFLSTKNKKIKIIWLPKNKGAAYCRNLAIKKSNSKYIAFIDSDDIWKKNKLKLQ